MPTVPVTWIARWDVAAGKTTMWQLDPVLLNSGWGVWWHTGAFVGQAFPKESPLQQVQRFKPAEVVIWRPRGQPPVSLQGGTPMNFFAGLLGRQYPSLRKVMDDDEFVAVHAQVALSCPFVDTWTFYEGAPTGTIEPCRSAPLSDLPEMTSDICSRYRRLQNLLSTQPHAPKVRVAVDTRGWPAGDTRTGEAVTVIDSMLDQWGLGPDAEPWFSQATAVQLPTARCWASMHDLKTQPFQAGGASQAAMKGRVYPWTTGEPKAEVMAAAKKWGHMAVGTFNRATFPSAEECQKAVDAL